MAIDLAPYKNRYAFGADSISDALWAVGSNETFEVDSQLCFVKNRGLKETQKFLDLGCGCLRGSAKIVDYLNDGNFYGADISEGLLSVIPSRLKMLGIKNQPNISLLNDYEFDKLFNIKFDMILSVSILTHMLPNAILPLFQGISKILKKNGIYYFTIYPTKHPIQEGDIEVSFFNKEWLIETGKQAGLEVKDIPGDYANPSPISNYIERVNFPEVAQWVMSAKLL